MTDQQASQLPPPPPGYTLDPSPAPQSTATTLPPPPAGYTLDASPTGGRSDFDLSSLGPNFTPDYTIDVYGTPLPAGPYPGDPKGPSIPLYNYPPGSTQLQPMTVQGLDKPLNTAEKVAMYPLDYMAGGMQQTGQGLAGLQHPQSFDQMAGATSDLIRGGMTIATPFFAPEMIAAPKAALTGLATFGAAQQGLEWTAKHLGLSPGVAKLAGDIGGLFGGWKAHQWLSDMAKIPDTRIANEINQKIDAHLAAAQDPTLTPEQRAASHAAVDALLTALRGEEGWKLPALFPNPNEMERQAYKYYRGLGGPPNAGMASGSPIVRGSTWLSGMTPAGGYMDVRAKAQTVEALRTRAAGLLREAAPPEGPAREFYSQVEDAINKSTPVNVPLRVDKDGSQISGDVKAPVDLRDLKYDLDPLWQKLQFLPMKDQSVSHAFGALKVLNNADDHITAPMAEVALSQFKQALIKREPGGIEGALTKTVIPKLQAAIDSAVKEYAGDDALTNLQAGRRAAAKEFGADWLSDQFKLAQQEGGFAHGKRLWNNWTTLTESAKRTMFTPDKVDELNRFFHALRMIEDNPNPSGTALAGAIGAQAGWAMHGGVMEPWFYLGQLAGGGFAKLLRSDLGVKLLTEGITIPRTTARGRFVEQQLKDILSQGQRRPAGGGPPEEPPPPPPPGGGGGPPPANPPAAPAGSEGPAPAGESAPEEETGLSLYQRAKALGDAALDRIRKRGSFSGERPAALPILDLKDMTVWAASRIAQGVTDPAALRKEILDQFGKIPRTALNDIAGRARDQEIKNVKDWKLGMSLDDIHPLISETIPLSPEVEPSLSNKKTRLYSGHGQEEETRIWTPDREKAEGPLAEAKSPSRLSYIDVKPEDAPALEAGERPEEKGRKLMLYTPGAPAERATGLLTEDVQRYLQDMVRKRLGPVPDDAPDAVKMRRLLRYGRGEFKEQLGMPYSGVDWYGPDTAEGDRLLRQVRPELADPDFDTIQKAISAAMSNNSNPQAEAFNGARIWEQAFDNWKRNPGTTLQFPEFQPDGETAWPAQGAGFQIEKLNRMIKELGIHNTAEFLRDPGVLGRSIKHFVPNAKEIRLNEAFPGSMVLGPKIGVYFDQIMNLPRPGSVVDVWMMRRMMRILGNLFDSNGKEIDAPRTEGERMLSMDLDGRLAREHDLATRDAQSVGWHYEQELYRRLGLAVKSFRRSDGIRKYLDSLGLK